MRLFGLMFVDNNERSLNLSTKSNEDLLRIYCKNAVSLHRSLATNGNLRDFTLLTNNSERIRRFLTGSELPVVQIDFSRDVPTGTRFYAAHYKLDVFRYMAGLESKLVGLCDLDMFCLRPMPEQAHTLLSTGRPIAYDITKQVEAAYSSARIRSDLAVVSGRSDLTRWFGGEFVCGTPHFFRNLADSVDRLFPQYVHALHQLHHVGDEMVTSAALGSLIAEGLELSDAADLDLVARYWNARTKHKQPPFRSYESAWLLHLPADKRFLARLADAPALGPKDFLRTYRRHRRLAIIERLLKSPVRVARRFLTRFVAVPVSRGSVPRG